MATKSTAATKPAAKPVAAAPVAKPAAAAAPAKPSTYTLTAAGTTLAPRQGTLRAKAWAIVQEHAGKPDGLAKATAAINALPGGKDGRGSITGANMLGWAASKNATKNGPVVRLG